MAGQRHLSDGYLPPAEEHQSAEKTPPEWLAPVITQYGKVRPYPEATAQLKSDLTYKVIFNVIKAVQRERDAVPGLERAARFVNLARLTKVPNQNLDPVVVLHGPATSAALSEDAYLKRHQELEQRIDRRA